MQAVHIGRVYVSYDGEARPKLNVDSTLDIEPWLKVNVRRFERQLKQCLKRRVSECTK